LKAHFPIKKEQNMARIIAVISMVGLLAGCASKSDMDALKVEVAALTQKVEELASKPAAAAAAAAPNAEAENAARELLKTAQTKARDGDIAGAKADLAQLSKKYGSTRTAARSARFKDELEVVGKDAKEMANLTFLTGDSVGFDMTKDAALVVFFEEWCPHCKREVPKLQATHEKYKGKMSVLGLTKITRSATEEKVMELLTSNNVSYPVAKESGAESAYYAVSGIPAAIVVNDGKVLWRGHPGTLSDEMIEKFINN
jgi:thiol-disulfide isomerase/thioredoxin/outer membrane murein-binding lipoprotein Lpp